MAQMNSKPDKSSPAYLAGKVKSGRHSLLMIVIFTIINLVLVWLDSGTYFLFSASVPYYVTTLVKAIENDFSAGAWVNGPTTMRALIFSFVVLTVYFLCWLFSDKRRGWLIAALVLFVLDSLAMVLFSLMLYDNLLTNVIDLVFHVWAIVDLSQAIWAAGKLKKLPSPLAQAVSPENNGPEL